MGLEFESRSPQNIQPALDAVKTPTAIGQFTPCVLLLLGAEEEGQVLVNAVLVEVKSVAKAGGSNGREPTSEELLWFPLKISVELYENRKFSSNPA